MSSNDTYQKQTHYNISVGHACPCAFALKSNAFRDASYPFDWITADPHIVQVCIRDDFVQFLDKSQYYHNEGDECMDIVRKAHCHHNVYGENFFRHHCPQCFPEHHKYYERCVARFQEVISDRCNDIVFFWMSIHDINNETHVENVIRQGVTKQLVETLIERVKAKWKIVVLDCYEHCLHRKAFVKETTSNFVWVKVHGMSKNTGVKYGDVLDNQIVGKVMAWYANSTHTNTLTQMQQNGDSDISKDIWPYALMKDKPITMLGRIKSCFCI